MFGKVGDMAGMMKKAMELKQEMGKVKEEIANTEVKGICGTSAEATVYGDMRLKSIKIAPETVQEGDTQKIEEIVQVAVNNAIEEAKKMSKEKMANLTGGIGIPGLESLFG